MNNPYDSNISNWSKTTEKLLAGFPISMDQLGKIVLASWEDIFHSKIGQHGFQIGRDIWPEPQIVGFLLHELIPLNIASEFSGQWRRYKGGTDCDVVCLKNDDFSFEIKTSSSKNGIFGNRSYTHISETSKKRRGSFFLAVNFEKFPVDLRRPEINLIRFGWLGSDDWIGQQAQSGQQAHLTKEAKAFKLRIIYERGIK